MKNIIQESVIINGWPSTHRNSPMVSGESKSAQRMIGGRCRVMYQYKDESENVKYSMVEFKIPATVTPETLKSYILEEISK